MYYYYYYARMHAATPAEKTDRESSVQCRQETDRLSNRDSQKHVANAGLYCMHAAVYGQPLQYMEKSMPKRTPAGRQNNLDRNSHF